MRHSQKGREKEAEGEAEEGKTPLSPPNFSATLFLKLFSELWNIFDKGQEVDEDVEETHIVMAMNKLCRL